MLVCVAAMLDCCLDCIVLKLMLLCYNCAINDYIYFLSTRSVVYMLNGVTSKYYIVWNSFYSVVGDEYGMTFVFDLSSYAGV